MALNSREKTLAWLVGGVAVVGIAYYAFTAFFWTPLQDIEKDIAGQQKILKDQQAYMDQHRAVAQDLAALQLKTDTASAAEQVINTVFQMARNTGFQVTNFAAPQVNRAAVSKTDFEELKFNASGGGSTLRVAQFLLALETAKIPMRVEDVTINTRKEGVDDLSAEIAITALVYSPKANLKPGARGTAVAARGGLTPSRGGPTTSRGGGVTVAATAPATAESVADIVARMAKRREEEMAATSTAPASQP